MPPVHLRARTTAVVVLTAVLAACDGAGGGAAVDRAPVEATSVDVVAPLCDAAGASDVETASQAFARAHGGLHDLARELQEAGEREAAGDLLEDKQAVESLLNGDAAQEELAPALGDLVDEVQRGLETLGHDAPGCPR